MPKHTMYVLNRRGHAPVVKWDPNNQFQTKTAEEVFGDLKEQKYHLYDVTDPSNTGKELKEFDPQAKEILAFAQPEGG